MNFSTQPLRSLLDGNDQADQLLRSQGVPTTREERENPARYAADLFFERNAVHSFQADKYMSLKGRACNLQQEIKALAAERNAVIERLDNSLDRISPSRRDGNEPALPPSQETAITALKVDAMAQWNALFQREERLEQELDPILETMSMVHAELSSANLFIDDSGISLFDEDSPMFSQLDQIRALAQSGAIVLTDTEIKILDTLGQIRENPGNLDLYREDLFPKEGERRASLSGEFKVGPLDGLKSLFTKAKFDETVRVKVFADYETTLKRPGHEKRSRNPGFNGALTRSEIERLRVSTRSASYQGVSVEDDLLKAHQRALKVSEEEGYLVEGFEVI